MTFVYPTAVSERSGSGHFNNCVFCTGVQLANAASHNAHPPTFQEAQALRVASGVKTDGAGPWDLVAAFKNKYGWTTYEFSGSADDLFAALRTGSFAAIHITYARWPANLRLDKAFLGGHCILGSGTDPHGNVRVGFVWIVDPLFYADSGYIGCWVAEGVLRAALQTKAVKTHTGTTFVPLANVLKVDQFYRPANPHVRTILPWFTTYTVHTDAQGHNVAVGSSKRLTLPGTIIPVSEREYPVLVQGHAILMRHIGAGPQKGLWLIAHGSTPFSN